MRYAYLSGVRDFFAPHNLVPVSQNYWEAKKPLTPHRECNDQPDS